MLLENKKRLIGRDAETARARRFLTDRSGSDTRVVLVSGKAGVGKSTLALEVLSSLDGYWLVSTKFDQYLDVGPASFFIDTLSALSDKILTLPQTERTRIRRRLVDAVSPNGQLVINLCPRMAEVLGAQPELIELAPQENQVRLSIVLRKLIGALSAPDRRLVLHLDDLQWADPATLRLLCDLVVDPDVQNVAVLVAFRSGEEGRRAEPVSTFLRAVHVAGVNSIEMTIEGLSQAEIKAFIHQSVELPAVVVEQLSRQIKQSTDGVPLAAVNFIDVLMQERTLQQNHEGSTWSALLDKAEELLGETGLGRLVDIRLSALDPRTRRTLTVAAAMGQKFDVALLAEVTATPADDVRNQIEALKARHLVLGDADMPDRLQLRFAHDTVQQAAYERADPAEMVHFRLGAARTFARRFNEESQNDWLFRSVSLFNSVLDAISDPAERRRVLELNALAARRALDSGGPTTALSFAQAASQILPDDAWSASYETARAVHLAGAEAAYLCNERDALERFSRDAAKNARSAADWARAREMPLQERVSAMAYADALDIALDTLRRLDAPLPRRPGKARVAASFARTMLSLRQYSMEQIYQLPRMDDERSEREMEILMLAASAAYFAQPNLFALIVLRMVRLSVQKGNCVPSAFGWECYGLAQCAMLGRVDAGYSYGILALRLVEKFKAHHLRARIHMLFNVFVRPWRESRAAIAEHLLEGEKAGVATGDLEFATYCMWHRCNDAFWSATPLTEVRAMAREALAISERYNQSKVAFLLGMLLEFVDWATTQPGDGALPDDARHEAYCLEHSDYTSLCYVKLYQALRHAIVGDMPACLAATREIDRQFEALQGQFYVPYYIALRTLAASECARTGVAPRAMTRLARRGALRLKRWAAKGAVDVVPLAQFADALANWAAGSRLKALEVISRALAATDRPTRDETAMPALYAAFAADAQERLEMELGISRGASDASSLAAGWARTWGSPVFASRLAGSQQWAPPGRAGPHAALVRQTRNGDNSVEDLAGGASARILDLLGGTRLELVVIEDGDAFTLMRAGQKAGGAVSVDLTETVAASDAAATARVASNEVTIVPLPGSSHARQLSVSLQQHDDAVACLLVQADRESGHGVPAAQLRAIALPIVAALRHERLKRRLRQEETRRISLSTAHGRFVPQYLLRALGHREVTDLHVGDFVQKRMSVMFCDMRGSTGIMERIGPRASMELFNEVFTTIESEVIRGGGYVDNFIGDAVLSLFETRADVVIRAAISVSHELRRLQRMIEGRNLPAPGFGLGLSTGDVVLGAVGGLNQIRGGSIGDTVNLAARIEGLNRRYGASTLISESTYLDLASPDDFALRQVDYITVVGKKEPIRLFEVLDALPEERAALLKGVLARYREGVGRYYAGDFAAAVEAFRDCSREVSGDIPTRDYLERASVNLSEGVAEGWTGVRQLTEK